MPEPPAPLANAGFQTPPPPPPVLTAPGVGALNAPLPPPPTPPVPAV